MKFKNIVLRGLALMSLMALSAHPAFAHHPLGGQAMTTFSHGLLSGVGHPILGFDHLFFVIAVGIAAVYSRHAVLAPAFFVAGMLAGVALILNGIALPFVEPMIAFSLLGLGGIVMSGTALKLPVAGFLFASLGLFHGWAFGEALAGQEGGAALPVIAGYMIGLAVVQWAIAVAAGLAVSKIWKAAEAHDVPARLAGGAVAGVGLFMTLEVIEGAAFAALGWS